MTTTTIDHPSGYLALTPRNARFTVRGVAGFVSYREQGKHLVMKGVVADVETLASTAIELKSLVA